MLAVACVVIGSSGSCTKRSPTQDTTIEFWTLALSPFRDSINSWITRFETQHPGVDVVWVDVPFDAADRKLIAAAAAGRAPDVINLSDRSFGRYVGLGAMADLSAHLPSNARDAYFSGVRGLGEIDGKLLALPWYLTTQVGMMNTELLREGGIEPGQLATDWRGLRSQAKAFRAKTGKYLFSLPLGEESQIPILLLGEGLPPLKAREDGRLAADLTRPEIVEFVRGWVDLYRAGDMPPEAATRDHAHLLDMYQNRRLATVDTGANFLKRIQQAAPGVYGATELRPPIVGRLGRAHIATMVVGVTT
jgi:putative chitobiose transport system substrate-binding protein